MKHRNGIEGTQSELVRGHDLREARYRGCESQTAIDLSRWKSIRRQMNQAGRPKSGHFSHSPLLSGSHRLARLHWTDAVRSHHFVVLVFDDVAMPDELARGVEPGPDAGDLPRIGDDRILEAS
jgi:hypothetical protein